MNSLQALVTAIGMVNCPHMTRRVRHSPLPKGMTFLLQVAAGESEALREAVAITGQTEAALQKAASFFVEQVLLSQPGDHYRVLGCNRDSLSADLRRHMALIMRWLHPDVVSGAATAHRFDKSLYVNRVTEAWEALKTEERRAAYDAALVARRKRQGTRPKITSSHLLPAPPIRESTFWTRLGKTHRPPPSKPEGFWSRVLFLLAGRS